jgi:hypothetical protein
MTEKRSFDVLLGVDLSAGTYWPLHPCHLLGPKHVDGSGERVPSRPSSGSVAMQPELIHESGKAVERVRQPYDNSRGSCG